MDSRVAPKNWVHSRDFGKGDLGGCYWEVDGFSHFPVMYAEDASYGPGGSIPGRYEF